MKRSETDIEFLNHIIRKELIKRQREYEMNMQIANAPFEPRHGVEPKKALQAARRNEKSIALLTSKLLCEHELGQAKTITIIGRAYQNIRCSKCKASTTKA